MKNISDPAIVFCLVVFLTDQMLFTVKKMKSSWYCILRPCAKSEFGFCLGSIAASVFLRGTTGFLIALSGLDAS